MTIWVEGESVFIERGRLRGEGGFVVQYAHRNRGYLNEAEMSYVYR